MTVLVTAYTNVRYQTIALRGRSFAPCRLTTEDDDNSAVAAAAAAARDVEIVFSAKPRQRTCMQSYQ